MKGSHDLIWPFSVSTTGSFRLAWVRRASYCPTMKRIFFFLMALSLCGGRESRGQDAATEERLNKLNGLVQDLLEDKAHQRKQIESLSREIQSLREQVSKPTGNYATQDDLRTLARKVQEIDQKRVEDYERMVKKIERLGETLASPPPGKKSKPNSSRWIILAPAARRRKRFSNTPWPQATCSRPSSRLTKRKASR